MITLGTYQIRIAKSYIIAHYKINNGQCVVQILLPGHIEGSLAYGRASLQSRNKTGKTCVWYGIHGSGEEAIKRWRCNFKVGNRNVGCWSHVAAIILQLGNEVHAGQLEEEMEHNVEYGAEEEDEDEVPNYDLD